MYVTNDDIENMYDSNLIYLTFIFVLSEFLDILNYIVYKIAGSPIKYLLRLFHADYFVSLGNIIFHHYLLK